MTGNVLTLSSSTSECLLIELKQLAKMNSFSFDIVHSVVILASFSMNISLFLNRYRLYVNSAAHIYSSSLPFLSISQSLNSQPAPSPPLSFTPSSTPSWLLLQDIQEVTGYVLIMSNYAEFMSLTSLRIIRGRTLYFPSPDDHTGFSLFVSHNYRPGSLTVGLKELQLVSLHGRSLVIVVIIVLISCYSVSMPVHKSLDV